MDDLDPAAIEVLARRAKAELRKRARGVRKTSTAAGLSLRSAAIVEQLSAMPVLRSARHIALFDAIVARNEVDLARLGETLRARGGNTYYPSIDPETRMMGFCDPGEPELMQDVGFGFREPAPGSKAARSLDVVLVPALRADPRGHRLGYGAGYYDRTLPSFCPPATSIVVVFDFELAPELPLTPGDFACNWVVTDKRIIRAGEDQR